MKFTLHYKKLRLTLFAPLSLGLTIARAATKNTPASDLFRGECGRALKQELRRFKKDRLKLLDLEAESGLKIALRL